MKKFDLLFYAPNLRSDIQKKMDSLAITTKDLCDEAKGLEIKGLNPSSISRFFSDTSGKREGSVTQGVLIYILIRLGFEIKMNINDIESDKEQLIIKATVFAKQFLKT
jgi:hypothetical protein